MPDVNVRVVARFRPPDEVQKKMQQGNHSTDSRFGVDFEGSESLHLTVPPDLTRKRGEKETQASRHTFTFDRVFQPGTDQDTVFTQVALDTVKDVLAGYNGTIFAYGQTGSGKTHTMFGVMHDSQLAGLVPRCTAYLFEGIAQSTGVEEVSIKCSFLEIYREEIRDLLTAIQPDDGDGEDDDSSDEVGPGQPSRAHDGAKSRRRKKQMASQTSRKNNTAVALKIRERSGVVDVPGLSAHYCQTPDDVLRFLKVGEKERSTAATAMNAVSSRSHSVLTLTLSQKMTDGSTRTSKLNLADLAGSERTKKTHAQGQTLEEAKMINQSLSALGNCINALTEPGRPHIPFRDSKLTFLLQESLGGNTKTTLMVCASMEAFNCSETLSTLNFAKRAKMIKNKAKINKHLSPDQMMSLITRLRKELTEARVCISDLEAIISAQLDGSEVSVEQAEVLQKLVLLKLSEAKADEEPPQATRVRPPPPTQPKPSTSIDGSKPVPPQDTLVYLETPPLSDSEPEPEPEEAQHTRMPKHEARPPLPPHATEEEQQDSAKVNGPNSERSPLVSMDPGEVTSTSRGTHLGGAPATRRHSRQPKALKPGASPPPAVTEEPAGKTRGKNYEDIPDPVAHLFGSRPSIHRAEETRPTSYQSGRRPGNPPLPPSPVHERPATTEIVVIDKGNTAAHKDAPRRDHPGVAPSAKIIESKMQSTLVTAIWQGEQYLVTEQDLERPADKAHSAHAIAHKVPCVQELPVVHYEHGEFSVEDDQARLVENERQERMDGLSMTMPTRRVKQPPPPSNVRSPDESGSERANDEFSTLILNEGLSGLSPDMAMDTRAALSRLSETDKLVANAHAKDRQRRASRLILSASTQDAISRRKSMLVSSRPPPPPGAKTPMSTAAKPPTLAVARGFSSIPSASPSSRATPRKRSFLKADKSRITKIPVTSPSPDPGNATPSTVSTRPRPPQPPEDNATQPDMSQPHSQEASLIHSTLQFTSNNTARSAASPKPQPPPTEEQEERLDVSKKKIEHNSAALNPTPIYSADQHAPVAQSTVGAQSNQTASLLPSTADTTLAVHDSVVEEKMVLEDPQDGGKGEEKSVGEDEEDEGDEGEWEGEGEGENYEEYTQRLYGELQFSEEQRDLLQQELSLSDDNNKVLMGQIDELESEKKILSRQLNNLAESFRAYIRMATEEKQETERQQEVPAKPPVVVVPVKRGKGSKSKASNPKGSDKRVDKNPQDRAATLPVDTETQCCCRPPSIFTRKFHTCKPCGNEECDFCYMDTPPDPQTSAPEKKPDSWTFRLWQ